MRRPSGSPVSAGRGHDEPQRADQDGGEEDRLRRAGREPPPDGGRRRTTWPRCTGDAGDAGGHDERAGRAPGQRARAGQVHGGDGADEPDEGHGEDPHRGDDLAQCEPGHADPGRAEHRGRDPGPRLRRGGKIAARAHPSANGHRLERVGTWASSAVIAAPQSRRSSGSVATAAASSRAGESARRRGGRLGQPRRPQQPGRQEPGCGEDHRRHDELGPLDVMPVPGRPLPARMKPAWRSAVTDDGRPVEDSSADECPHVPVPSQDSRGCRPRSARTGPTSAARSVASARPGPVSR